MYYDSLSFLNDTISYRPTVSNVAASPSTSTSSPLMSPSEGFEETSTTQHQRGSKSKSGKVEGAILEALNKVNAPVIIPATQPPPSINPICQRISELLGHMPQQERTILEIKLLQVAYEGAVDYLN